MQQRHYSPNIGIGWGLALTTLRDSTNYVVGFDSEEQTFCVIAWNENEPCPREVSSKSGVLSPEVLVDELHGSGILRVCISVLSFQ
jgi:hypothetical protein